MDLASLKTRTFLDQERGHTEMEHHCTQTCKFHGYVIRLGARGSQDFFVSGPRLASRWQKKPKMLVLVLGTKTRPNSGRRRNVTQCLAWAQVPKMGTKTRIPKFVWKHASVHAAAPARPEGNLEITTGWRPQYVHKSGRALSVHASIARGTTPAFLGCSAAHVSVSSGRCLRRLRAASIRLAIPCSSSTGIVWALRWKRKHGAKHAAFPTGTPLPLEALRQKVCAPQFFNFCVTILGTKIGTQNRDTPY